MKKTIMKFLAVIMILMFNMSLILDSNTITANATTEVNIETNEKKSFSEKLKENREKRKKESEKKKQTKELNKNIKKAKKSLNKKKYEDVLDILKTELNKDIDVSEAKILYDMVEYYMGAKVDFDNKMYEVAKEKLNSIDSSYEDYKIKKDIEKLMENVEEKLAYKDEINTKIDEVAILIDKKMFYAAKTKIGELLNKDIDDEQKLRLTDISNTVDFKIEEEKRLEEEKKQKEALKKQQEATNKKPENKNPSSNSASSGNKSYYIAAGNRYYHNTPSCKFLEGAPTTVTSNISNKFPCNCVKYN